MTAQAVNEGRAAEASEARLSLYSEVLSRIAGALAVGDFDAIWAIRDELTQWAPWVISLPVWERAYDARKATQGLDDAAAATVISNFAHKLARETEAVSAVLDSGNEQPMPNELLGDISADVEQYAKAHTSASAVT